MCTQTYRTYTCGCEKPEEFKQCPERLGTNVKCNPMTKEALPDSGHTCSKHMLKPGTDEMERLGTNVKCNPMTKEALPDSGHTCSKHMVKPGTDEMERV